MLWVHMCFRIRVMRQRVSLNWLRSGKYVLRRSCLPPRAFYIMLNYNAQHMINCICYLWWRGIAPPYTERRTQKNHNDRPTNKQTHKETHVHTLLHLIHTCYIDAQANHCQWFVRAHCMFLLSVCWVCVSVLKYVRLSDMFRGFPFFLWNIRNSIYVYWFSLVFLDFPDFVRGFSHFHGCLWFPNILHLFPWILVNFTCHSLILFDLGCISWSGARLGGGAGQHIPERCNIYPNSATLELAGSRRQEYVVLTVKSP